MDRIWVISYGDDAIDHFREKSLFFQDTRDTQEYDAKNRLSIPGLSYEKLLAEVISDKRKPTLFVLATIRETTAEIIFLSIPHFLVNTIIDMILLNLSKSTFFVFIT